jgi:hypothetical protein
MAALAAALIVTVPGLSAHAQTKKRTMTRKAAAPKVAPRVPVGTQLKIRLEETLDSKSAKDGDQFTATVLTPAKFADSTVTGHIAQVKQSGKIKGKSSLSLVFDRIQYPSGEIAPFGAQVVRVYGEKSVKDVDEEGNVKGGSQTKDTAVRTGGGAALGAIIGGVAGGGKGAAIGAAVGGGAGFGSVFLGSGNRVKLESGTEILIRGTR